MSLIITGYNNIEQDYKICFNSILTHKRRHHHIYGER